MMWLVTAVVIWGIGWTLNGWLARRPASGMTALAVPVIFGLTLIVIWEGLVRGLEISPVLLPPPSAIAARFAASTAILWEDFVQTVIKGALTGYLLGCGAAFVIAVAIDRFPFLQRGLLPVGNFVAALPVIGMAPILVMWFGFDWQSKAAVVVVMVFFPILVNTVQGLAEASAMQKDLMRTYAAGYVQTLLKLRLPAAMPFIFNGLKFDTPMLRHNPASTASSIAAQVSSIGASSTIVCRFSDITSATCVLVPSRSWPTTSSARSRSVTMPTSRPPSVTPSAETWASRISAAASRTRSDPSQRLLRRK